MARSWASSERGSVSERRIERRPSAGSPRWRLLTASSDRGLSSPRSKAADGHRAAVHALDHLAIGLVLLFLARHVAAPRKMNRCGTGRCPGAVLKRGVDVRHLDVGPRSTSTTRSSVVARAGLEQSSLERAPSWTGSCAARIPRGCAVGIHDQHAARALFTITVPRRGSAGARCAGRARPDAHAARQDRGVRGGAADIGDEGGESWSSKAMMSAWREVVRDQNLGLAFDPARLGREVRRVLPGRVRAPRARRPGARRSKCARAGDVRRSSTARRDSSTAARGPTGRCSAVRGSVPWAPRSPASARIWCRSMRRRCRPARCRGSVFIARIRRARAAARPRSGQPPPSDQARRNQEVRNPRAWPAQKVGLADGDAPENRQPVQEATAG